MEKQVIKKVDNSKEFRKIVRDYNRDKGFNFKLPKDTDYSGEYAHPVHVGEKITISSQISTGHETPYGLYLKIDAGEVELGFDRDFTLKDIEKIIGSDAYKWRIDALLSLKGLQEELGVQVMAMKQNLLSDAIAETEKEETYDAIITTAKRLYKG